MTSPTGRTTVHADLHLEVDGRPVAVTADGDEITVRADDAGAVAAAVSTVVLPGSATRVVSRRAVARVGDTLSGAGLTVTVVGPAGVVAVLGERAAPGRLTRLVFGTDRLALGRWDVVRRAFLPTLVATARRRVVAVRRRVRR